MNTIICTEAHLGSILAITDADGDVIEERQFGAWGLVDKFLDNSSGGMVFNHQSLLGRGYTGHEHFFEVSLIHMNGRMYDAQLGRFLSPDNYIQEPFNTQNYNRYGYVLNNPLMYTDPSGELFGGEGGGLFGSILGGLIWLGKAIFGGHDATPYDNQGSYQNAAPAPTNNYSNLWSSTSVAPKPKIVRSIQDFGLPNGALSTYADGYASGFKSFWGNLGNSISNAWNDPVGSWKKRMLDNGGWKNLIPVYGPAKAAYQMGWGSAVEQMKNGYDAVSNFSDGNYYEAGVINGYSGGEGSLNLGLTLLTAGTVKGAGGLARLGGLGAKTNKAIVIGEGMEAIKVSAKALQSQGVNAKWYQAWSKNFPQGRRMTPRELGANLRRNERWINSKIDQGYKIYDIGPRRNQITSPFYQLEREIIKRRKYPTTFIGE